MDSFFNLNYLLIARLFGITRVSWETISQSYRLLLAQCGTFVKVLTISMLRSNLLNVEMASDRGI